MLSTAARLFFFFSSRRRHTRFKCDWSSDVCSSDLGMQKKLALAAAVIHSPRILFLDEPFEGVDALAAGALKAMLQRMTARGVTIFLTSHVLEIVERLCSHVAIIHKGRLVAQGSLEELRAGVAASSALARGEAPADGEKLTLEQIFVSIVGEARGRRPLQQLS